jgi:predicted nucleic acid-binding protein
MYLDSAYIAKVYLNESDSERVRALLEGADSVVSSLWAFCEVTCVFHRQWREGWLTAQQRQELVLAFLEHVNSGVWTLIPVTERILKRAVSLVSSLPSGVPIRAGDAIHLTTAQDLGEREIWTNDRHMLAAARYFGLAGRSV